MKTKKMVKLNNSNGFEYSYRWVGLANILGLLFSAIFFSFVVFTMSSAKDNIGTLLFGVMFIVVIGVVFYTQLCYILNKTKFRITESNLEAISGPLPLPYSSWVINTDDIQNVYTRKYRSGFRVRVLSTNIIKKDGNPKEIFSLWNNVADPLYFESELKSFLKIADVPVEGQYAE